MSKLLFCFCVVLLVGTVISATTNYGNRHALRGSNVGTQARNQCGRHGDDCTGKNAVQCCGGTTCHPYAGKCQARITEADLAEARFKILGRREKDN
ncbi:omega-conotoxin-like protein 1 [Diprion similis]|uniref:omega-conotoxin-like protein 1 n=1 Tax=Diprion similis TaxID=362088 RepID=UPI001EF8D4AC|nr:omega-conotoxin-like protein 1 [Diprion similis]